VKARALSMPAGESVQPQAFFLVTLDELEALHAALTAAAQAGGANEATFDGLADEAFGMLEQLRALTRGAA
jgi:hypothetical protein